MMYHLLLLKKIKSKDMEIFLLFCIICVKNKILVFLKYLFSCIAHNIWNLYYLFTESYRYLSYHITFFESFNTDIVVLRAYYINIYFLIYY